jgi:hypothetical protein
MTRLRAVSSLFALAAIVAGPRAQAQAPEDQAAARSLFDDGRTLMKSGKFAEACGKFEAAARLYSSAGVLLNLGDCYAKVGRTASAWTEFGESAAAADRANRRDQALEARRRQADMKPNLSRLTIVVAHEVAGLVITRDDGDLAPAAWGAAIPIDSGLHHIHARATGYEPWETDVTISTPGQTISVEVPRLVASPVPAPVVAPVTGLAEAPPRASTGMNADGASPVTARRSALAIGLLGGGALVGIGGGVLMVIEAGRASTARANDVGAGYPASKSEYDSAKAPYFMGLGAAILGGAAATAGLVWMVTAHGESAPSTTVGISPWVVPRGGGLAMGAAW